MKELILISFIILQSASVFGGDGGEQGAFLKVGIGGRAHALGKAFTSICDDGSASYWNPAGLTQLSQKEVIAMYSEPFMEVEDVSYHALSIALPTHQGGVGISVIYSAVEGISLIESKNDPNIPNPLGKFDEFSVGEGALILSYARAINSRLSGGVSLKGIFQRLDDEQEEGVGLDFGLLFRISKHGKLGVVLKDLANTKIRGDCPPLRVKFGGCYLLLGQILLSGEIETLPTRSLSDYLEERIGLEWTPIKILALRAGYTSDTKEVTAGIGIDIGEIHFDYSYSINENLGDTQRFSMSLKF